MKAITGRKMLRIGGGAAALAGTAALTDRRTAVDYTAIKIKPNTPDLFNIIQATVGFFGERWIKLCCVNQ